MSPTLVKPANTMFNTRWAALVQKLEKYPNPSEEEMRKLISAKTTGHILLALFGLLVAFHIMILFNLLPSNVVWGGRAGSSSSLRTLLTISLIFNVLFAIAVAAKVGYIKVGKDNRVINVFLWIIFAYLLLNTAGNLASSSSFETLLFTPITIVAAFLVLRLAIET